MGAKARRRMGGAATALLALAIAGPPTAAATEIIVDSLADVAADDGACTLREAISAANGDAPSGTMPGECPAGSGADTITIAVDGTVALSANLPEIAGDLVVDGGGHVTIDGGGAFQAFKVTSGTVALSGLTITNGRGAGAPTQGGAIDNAGTLTITDSTIAANRAEEGGGIWNSGTLTVSGSRIIDNRGGGGAGGGFGGGAYGGRITIADSIVSRNFAGHSGGVGGDELTIVDSTISRNGGDFCGGVCGGDVTISGSTISGNGAYLRTGGIGAETLLIVNSTVSGNGVGGDGGGIYAGSVTAINTTITGNRAMDGEPVAGGSGGGIWAETVTLRNSIVAGNISPGDPDVAGTITGRTSSLVGVPAGGSLADILDPAGLADNGGPTMTIALVQGVDNPALEGGDAAICAAAPVNSLDQRGLPRPAAACDIGAFESQEAIVQPSPAPTHPGVTPPPTATQPGPPPDTDRVPPVTDLLAGLAVLAGVGLAAALAPLPRRVLNRVGGSGVVAGPSTEGVRRPRRVPGSRSRAGAERGRFADHPTGRGRS